MVPRRYIVYVVIIFSLMGCAVHSSPVPPPASAAPSAQLAAGAGHTCLLSGGRVRCWGAGQFGQIGKVVDGVFSLSGQPVEVDGLGAEVISISAGAYHTCAVTSAGKVLCWGQNDSGQLGPRTASDPSVPAEVAYAVPAAAVSAGAGHTCLLTSAGEAACWGSNTAGQLGDGTTQPGAAPQKVKDLPETIRSLSLGTDFSCAVGQSGKVYCWGRGARQEDGKDMLENSSLPLLVPGLPGAATQVAAGGYHACAMIQGGAVWCWGTGDAAPLVDSRAAQVNGLSGPAAAITAGDGHTCALLASGEVACWGDNYFDQLATGDGLSSGLATNGTPLLIKGVSSAAVIDAGSGHTCALIADGTIHCWGDGSSGQLGDGSLRWK
jgi:alpha-tubulin suppressor-like RCC1 family protein